MKIKLEYSEQQQAFHGHRESSATSAGTNSYVVLGEVDDVAGGKFLQYMDAKYPHRDNLPLEIVQIEFDDFFKN